jgi:hypothetical protein
VKQGEARLGVVDADVSLVYFSDVVPVVACNPNLPRRGSFI